MRPCLRCKIKLVESGLCETCELKRAKTAERAVKQYDRRRGSSCKRGYDARWRKYREAYLDENPLCVRCKSMGTMTQATEVDHIRPVVNGQDDPGFWDPGNHQALCKRCHSRKTRGENR